MKNIRLIAILLVFSIILLAGCSIDPTDANELIGTSWDNASITVGTGTRITFEDQDTVTIIGIILGFPSTITPEVTASYTYNQADQSGTIYEEALGVTVSYPFTIDREGKILTLNDDDSLIGGEYTYNILGREAEEAAPALQ